MLVISHRGDCRQAPENTLAAFAAAVELGVDGVETDVRSSADGQAVLFHDRLAPDGSPVAALSRDTLSAQVGYDVPTLAAALEQHADLLWVLEIKSPSALEPLVEVIEQYRAGSAKLLVISFWHDVIDRLPLLVPVDRGVLMSHRPATGDARQQAVLPHGVETLVWNYEFMDEALLTEMKTGGFRNLVYGPVSAPEHERCAAAGLEGVITDFPQFLLPRRT